MKLFNKNYLLMVFGNSISSIGDLFYTSAIAYWVYNKTNSTTLVAFLSSITLVILAVGGPFTGMLADKSKKKKTIILMDLFRGILMLLFGIIGVLGQINITYIVITSILMAIFSVIYKPFSNLAFLSYIPRDDIVRGQSISSIVMTASSVGGKAVSGILIGIFGVPIAIIINGISFILVSLSECFLKEVYPRKATQDKEHISRLQLFNDGCKMIIKNKEIAFITKIYVLMVLGMIGTNAVLITFVINAGYSIEQYGYLLSFLSLAGVLSAILLSIKKISIKTQLKLIIIGLLLGMIFYIIGFNTKGFILLTLFLSFGELFFGVGFSILDAIFVIIIPEENRGLTLGFISTICTLASIISNMLYGFLSELIGIKTTFITIPSIFIILFMILILTNFYEIKKISNKN